MRRRTYEILDVGHDDDWLSNTVDTVLLLLIVTNVAALVIATDDSIYSAAPGVFKYFELVSFSIFAVEYVLRLWSCTVDPEFAHPVMGRLRYIFQPLMITDAVAVISYFAFLFYPAGLDLGVLRALRLVSRTARLARYSPGLRALSVAISAKRDELLAVVSVVAALLVIAASLMYYIEDSAQPEEFSSIPAAMWWSIITVTTVGYGDVAPVTPLGRMLAGVIALLGIGIFALPAGILGSGFMEHVGRRGPPGATICPRCGLEFGGPRPGDRPPPPPSAEDNGSTTGGGG